MFSGVDRIIFLGLMIGGFFGVGWVKLCFILVLLIL